MTREEKIKELAEIYVERGLTIEDLIDMAIDYGETIHSLKEHYKEAVKFVAENIDKDEYNIALKRIDKYRCPLSLANQLLYWRISDLMGEYTLDNDLENGWWWDIMGKDVEDVFWDIEI